MGLAFRFERTGAFDRAPPRAASGVRFVVGQPLYHRLHGRCVAYGWEPSNCAVEPPAAVAESDDGDGGFSGDAAIVDNRRYFAGIDAGCAADQPHYRVLRHDGAALLCAQEMLTAVPDARGLAQPIKGSSFFFTRADGDGVLVPNPDLTARYPEDARLLAEPRARVEVLRTDSTAKYAQLWLSSWGKFGRPDEGGNAR